MNTPVVIREKVKKHEQRGYMSLEVKVGENCFSIPGSSLLWSSNQGLPGYEASGLTHAWRVSLYTELYGI